MCSVGLWPNAELLAPTTTNLVSHFATHTNAKLGHTRTCTTMRTSHSCGLLLTLCALLCPLPCRCRAVLLQRQQPSSGQVPQGPCEQERRGLGRLRHDCAVQAHARALPLWREFMTLTRCLSGVCVCLPPEACTCACIHTSVLDTPAARQPGCPPVYLPASCLPSLLTSCLPTYLLARPRILSHTVITNLTRARLCFAER